MTHQQSHKELNKLLYGSRGTLYIENYNDDETDIQPSAFDVLDFVQQCVRLLSRMPDAASMRIVLNSEKTVEQIVDLVESIHDSLSIDGLVLRKSFLNERNLVHYTNDEWMAILAQYSITYGWEQDFESWVDTSPVDILDNYLGTLNLEETVPLQNYSEKKLKTISFVDDIGLSRITKSIISSKSPLKAHDLKIIQKLPANILQAAVEDVRIPMKDTLVEVASVLIANGITTPIFDGAIDVLKFVVTKLSTGDTPVGQITKDALRAVKVRIPTATRKYLLINLEALASRDNGVRKVAEDMIRFQEYYMYLVKRLRYGRPGSIRRKYPKYSEALDLLYSGDRSWTFNGRYHAAVISGNYAKAVEVAAEKPGYLISNLLTYMRMETGVSIPVKKADDSVTTKKVETRNPMMEALNKTKGVTVDDTGSVVRSGSVDFLLSNKFDRILRKVNLQVLWRTLNQLQKADILEPTYKRRVNGVWVYYEVPVPGIKQDVIQSIVSKLAKAIIGKVSIGKVYLDDQSKQLALSFSDKKSTETLMSGSFIGKNSKMSIDGLRGGKTYMRLGIAWRGKDIHSPSLDIDHSSTFYVDNDPVFLYYGSPTLSVDTTIVGTSSGDITHCGGPNSLFSVELIDLDIDELRKTEYKMFTSAINYSARGSFSDLEVYMFISFVDNRTARGREVKIELSDMDYSFMIDPDCNENGQGYIGFFVDFSEDTLQPLVTLSPLQTQGGSNVTNQNNKLMEIVNDYMSAPALTLGDAFGIVAEHVSDPSDADVVITTDQFILERENELSGIKVLNPMTQMTEIQSLLF